MYLVTVIFSISLLTRLRELSHNRSLSTCIITVDYKTVGFVELLTVIIHRHTPLSLMGIKCRINKAWGWGGERKTKNQNTATI